MRLDPDASIDYVDFVIERHRIWERRQHGEAQPWTNDPILAAEKFTNVFRVLDHDSQFLLTELLTDDLTPEDTLFRAFMFRHTGRVEAWEVAKLHLGRYPLVCDLIDLSLAWGGYREQGGKVFTPAYLVYPQSAVKGTDKVQSILKLAARLFADSSELMNDFLAAPDQRSRFAVLRRNKGVADFMSMQVLTDWGYSRFGADLEDEYVVLGPGARRGAAALLGRNGGRLDDVHAWAMRTIREHPGCPMLWMPGEDQYRVPSAMDVQNTLCEFSKYVRLQTRAPKIKPYVPAHPGPQPAPVFPAHWWSA